MTNVSEIAARAPGRPRTASSNGGPPGAAGAGGAIAVAVLVAFLVGMAVARWLDWRSHAHPHD